MFCLGYIIHCFKDVINDLSKSTEVVFFVCRRDAVYVRKIENDKSINMGITINIFICFKLFLLI